MASEHSYDQEIQRMKLWLSDRIDWIDDNITLLSVDQNVNNSQKIKTIRLEQNYPNPFNNNTNIHFHLSEDARVNLGLKADTNKEAFYHDAHRAEALSIPFDYHDHVHDVPSKKHDLLLIPPGTVHGSGKGNVVLEISATTYRYTFKIYDHLRPDLNGAMRPIHLRHVGGAVLGGEAAGSTASHVQGNDEVFAVVVLFRAAPQCAGR